MEMHSALLLEVLRVKERVIVVAKVDVEQHQFGRQRIVCLVG